MSSVREYIVVSGTTLDCGNPSSDRALCIIFVIQHALSHVFFFFYFFHPTFISLHYQFRIQEKTNKLHALASELDSSDKAYRCYTIVI